MKKAVGSSERRALVVENPGFALAIRNGDGMVDPEAHVAQHHESESLGGDTGATKGEIFGDRVVLTLAALAQEFERRLPAIALAPIAQRGHIGMAIDSGIDGLELRVERQRAQPRDEIAPLCDDA